MTQLVFKVLRAKSLAEALVELIPRGGVAEEGLLLFASIG